MKKMKFTHNDRTEVSSSLLARLLRLLLLAALYF
jgi:hypothetical protein